MTSLSSGNSKGTLSHHVPLGDLVSGLKCGVGMGGKHPWPDLWLGGGIHSQKDYYTWVRNIQSSFPEGLPCERYNLMRRSQH